MSDAHRMHLKGPWQYRLLDSDANANPTAAKGRIKLPAAWQDCFADYRGSVRYERHFNCPTNLDPHERVYVVFEEIGGEATIRLNETLLGNAGGGPGPFEFEIKSLLQPRNLLVVDVAFHGGNERPGGLWAPVALEIRGG
jgi:hypothetical protein